MSRSRRGLAAMAVFLAAAILSGAPCAARPAPGGAAAGIVLVVIDGLRADRVGPATPALERLAERSCVFLSARSQAPWSPPSAVSLLTSMQPSRHGALDRRLQEAAPQARTLGEALRDAGWRTAAFTGGAGFAARTGLSAGFDVYEDSPALAGFERTVPRALRWLDGLEPGRRFLLLVHGCDLAACGASDASVSTAAYDAGVAAMDRRLEPLLRRLEEKRYADVLVAVTSDRGQSLGEHESLPPRSSLYEESLRVPLIFRLPGAGARRVASGARLVDVMPTALDYAGVEPDASLAAQMDGVSLRPLAEGRPLALDSFAEAAPAASGPRRSLVSRDGWKLVLDGARARLFHLTVDPEEKRDEAARRPDLAQELAGRLRGEAARRLDAEGLRRGTWKLLRENGRLALYDLSADPYLRRDLSQAEPAVVSRLEAEMNRRAPAAHRPSEELKRKLREAGYW